MRTFLPQSLRWFPLCGFLFTWWKELIYGQMLSLFPQLVIFKISLLKKSGFDVRVRLLNDDKRWLSLFQSFLQCLYLSSRC